MKRRTDHAASYKDPSAKVFIDEDEPGFIFREISPSYLEHYRHFQDSGLAEELVKKKWLIPFSEIESDYKILKADKIPFVSFPYEWTFTQWKEAAMLTMKLQFQALKFGMILKDATPFNIVFNGATPVFVDISSFEKYEEGTPWVAYKQFSENFYMPLLLYKYFDAVANDIYLNNSHGIKLATGLPLLPLRAHLDVNTIFFLTLPEKIRRKSTPGTGPLPQRGNSGKTGSRAMMQFADRLFNNISKLNQSKKVTRWNDYYDTWKIEPEYLQEKETILQSWFENDFAEKTLIDAGCNTGNFSMLLAGKVKSVIAFDEDSRSVDELYRFCRENKISNISCFTANLSSPTPATGWDNAERPSLFERLHGDVCLALALIHHLAISTYARFDMMVEVFSRMSPELIIEFVPPEDEKVQILLAGRQETFSWYNWDEFINAFSKQYDLIKSHRFTNNRVLIHFIKKKNAA